MNATSDKGRGGGSAGRGPEQWRLNFEHCPLRKRKSPKSTRELVSPAAVHRLMLQGVAGRTDSGYFGAGPATDGGYCDPEFLSLAAAGPGEASPTQREAHRVAGQLMLEEGLAQRLAFPPRHWPAAVPSRVAELAAALPVAQAAGRGNLARSVARADTESRLDTSADLEVWRNHARILKSNSASGAFSDPRTANCPDTSAARHFAGRPVRWHPNLD